MKNLIACLLFTFGTSAWQADANIMINPDFSIGADGLDFWEAYDITAGITDPALFVSVAGGMATVSGFSSVETAFYQTFMPGNLTSGTYLWQADIAGVTDPSAFMFVKVFTDGNFAQFDGSKFQQPALVDGSTMTLTYEHDSSDLVQFGFSGFSLIQGYQVSNLSLTVVPEPASAILLTGGMLAGTCLLRRRR